MDTQTTIIFSVLLALVIIVLIINNLIKKKNAVRNIFEDVNVLLKKRYDLIPNLVASVQQYMIHEKTVLAELTKMRAKAINSDISAEEKIDIQNKVQRTLEGILVAVEAYPELKANQNFIQLQAALNEVEEQISAARRAYNATVTEYNNAVETIPSNLIAMMIGYKRKPLMETPEHEREAISVKKLFNT
jgi:LemA protein